MATFGCKLNQSESEIILAQFRSAGYRVTDDAAKADVLVVNTCSVTAAAERKVRTMLRSRRRNPLALVMAVGCMAERVPDELAALNTVHVVLGNDEKSRILDYVIHPSADEPVLVHIGRIHARTQIEDFPAAAGERGRTRAYLKVQDGCSQHCTYCIVPRLRGRGRSLSVEIAVEHLRRLVGNGFAEVVLTGVALGTYGQDLGLTDGLAHLLVALQSVPGLQRLRLGSVEPWAVSDRLLRVIADSEVICPHLHLPLQSADDTILRRMGRQYSVQDIERIWNHATVLRNDWGFGSDIIVGFPGESPASFSATHQYLSDSPLSYLHVFPFSPRPGTPAVRLPDFVPTAEIRARVRHLKKLDEHLRLRFRNRHLGSVQPVLFENRRAGGLLAGHSADYLDVHADVPDSLVGRICPVRITTLHPNGVVGSLVH